MAVVHMAIDRYYLEMEVDGLLIANVYLEQKNK